MNHNIPGGGGIEQSSPAPDPCAPTSAIVSFADTGGGTAWWEVLAGTGGAILGGILLAAAIIYLIERSA